MSSAAIFVWLFKGLIMLSEAQYFEIVFIIKIVPDDDMSSQYGESNSYSAFNICWNNAASFSS